MSYQVLLTDDAVFDLEDLHQYIKENDSFEKAEYVLDKFEEKFRSLTNSPHRGSYPKELLDTGLREYREIYFKPYRIIYRIMGQNVYVTVIADGRRDMMSLLERRLLSGSR